MPGDLNPTNQRVFWLLKTEPSTFSIDDLARDKVTSWEGVRNYLARNRLRNQIQEGDLVLIYHSNAKPTGVAGIGRVVSKAYPDTSADDPSSEYFYAKGKKGIPVWFTRDIEFVEKFDKVVTLQELKNDFRFDGMTLVQKGQRCSVLEVSAEHFALIRDRSTNQCEI